MRLSVIASAIVATLVGFVGTMALVAGAARHVGADAAQTASWMTAISIGVAIVSLYFTLRHRIPMLGAWSVAGAALILTAPSSVTLAGTVGACVFSAALMVLVGLVPALESAVARLPAAIAGAMLAGLLLRFVLALFQGVTSAPLLVLPVLLTFLIARLIYPASGTLVAIATGLAMVWVLDIPVATLPPLGLSHLVWVTPSFEPATLIGLGLPFFLVTMATQQLPGFAVLRVCGYTPPVRSALIGTGLASLLLAPFGGFSINLSAVTAAICTGPDAHPDPGRRWQTGPWYALCYVILALFGGSLVTLFTALPPVLVSSVVGVALIGPLTGALTAALAHDNDRFAAVCAFAVTASGMALMGVGSAFWGLVAGLAVLGMERLARRLR